MIRVSDVVSTRTAAWEDKGQECHVSQPPTWVIKPIRPAFTGETEGKGAKDPGGRMAPLPRKSICPSVCSYLLRLPHTCKTLFVSVVWLPADVSHRAL